MLKANISRSWVILWSKLEVSAEHFLSAGSSAHVVLDPLKTKRRLIYLKTQFVPRSKHF